jgi:hypothetical protein
MDPCDGTFHAEIFVTNNTAGRLMITEGTLLTIKPEDFATLELDFHRLHASQ